MTRLTGGPPGSPALIDCLGQPPGPPAAIALPNAGFQRQLRALEANGLAELAARLTAGVPTSTPTNPNPNPRVLRDRWVCTGGPPYAKARREGIRAPPPSGPGGSGSPHWNQKREDSFPALGVENICVCVCLSDIFVSLFYFFYLKTQLWAIIECTHAHAFEKCLLPEKHVPVSFSKHERIWKASVFSLRNVNFFDRFSCGSSVKYAGTTGFFIRPDNRQPA